MYGEYPIPKKTMSESITLTIVDRDLKIKFYPGNDLLEVLGISQKRDKNGLTIRIRF